MPKYRTTGSGGRWRHSALVFAALTLAAVWPGGSLAAGGAHLHVAKLDPLVVEGTRFGPRERVVVSVRSGGQDAERRSRAGARGRFTVEFPGGVTDPCLGGSVTAEGAAGSEASAKLPQRQCPPSL